MDQKHKNIYEKWEKSVLQYTMFKNIKERYYDK